MHIRVQIENSNGDVRTVNVPLLEGDITGQVDVINGEKQFSVETFSVEADQCQEPVGV